VPNIHITNTGQIIEINLVTSLLVAFQIHQVPIENVCGGRSKCGKCVIKVLEGQRFLSPRKQAEIKKLQNINAGENMRLACQTYTRDDIKIEIINLKVQ
jgi:ferredoxin